MKKYFHKEKRRKEALDKLRTSLENAYLLKQDQAHSTSDEETHNYLGLQNKSVDSKVMRKRNKQFLKKVRRQPVMKLINTTDNINKFKKNIN